jgi:hypothetical protein
MRFEEKTMRLLNIALLVAAGAIGGALIMKVTQRANPAPQAIATGAAQTAQDAAPTSAPPEQPATQPVTPAEPLTSPKPAALPERVAPPSPFPEKRRTAKSETRDPVSRARPQSSEPVTIAENTAPQPMPEPQAMPQPQTTPEPQAAPMAAPQPVPNPEPALPPAPEQQANVAPAPAPPPPAPNKVTLNSGMLIPVRLVDGLSNDRNVAGDAFAATLDQPLVAGGFVIAERGARVEGRVVTSDRGSKVNGRSSLAVELTSIRTSDGQSVPIRTDSFEKHGPSTGNKSAEKVAGGAVIGAVIGAIAGGGKGAAIGGGVGAGAGAGDVALTGAQVVKLPSETRISFRLSAPVTITEQSKL